MATVTLLVKRDTIKKKFQITNNIEVLKAKIEMVWPDLKGDGLYALEYMDTQLETEVSLDKDVELVDKMVVIVIPKRIKGW